MSQAFDIATLERTSHPREQGAMSVADVTSSTSLDAGEQEAETKDTGLDDETEIISVPPEDGSEVWCQRSFPPAKSTVVKRARSPSPKSSAEEVTEEGKLLKRVKFALTPSPPLRAVRVKVEVEEDHLLEDASDDICARGTSVMTKEELDDAAECTAEAEPSSRDDDDSEDDLADVPLRRDATQNDNEIRSGHMADIAEDWLLDPAIASQSGMLVTVHGSLPTRRSSGWHNGAYEDAQAVVLSVFNTGPGNTTFASTARVKFLKPLNPDMNTFVVPASFLHPVKPDDVGQDAVIIGGEYIGSLARLREEVSEGWFFVSAAYDHFEIKAANLVRVLDD